MSAIERSMMVVDTAAERQPGQAESAAGGAVSATAALCARGK